MDKRARFEADGREKVHFERAATPHVERREPARWRRESPNDVHGDVDFSQSSGHGLDDRVAAVD
jgi:hypothetical protein